MKATPLDRLALAARMTQARGGHFVSVRTGDLVDALAEIDRLRTVVASLIEEPGVAESGLQATYRLVEIDP